MKLPMCVRPQQYLLSKNKIYKQKSDQSILGKIAKVSSAVRQLTSL